MNTTFTLDLEKIKELNGSGRDEAFFKYLKRVSKNKTPLILQGTKVADYWECSVTECSIPVSKFYCIKLPAVGDVNPEGAKLSIQLTENLISQFENGTKFTFKESEIEIKRANLRVKCSYKATAVSITEQLEDYQELLDRTATDKVLKLTKSSAMLDILKELKTSPDAAIYVNSESITLIKDTVFFRAKNTETYSSVDAKDLYINMYLANMLTNILDYVDKLELTISEMNTIITGYDAEGTVIVKNVSAVFEADEDCNPTDEDLSGITPSQETVVEIELDKFVEELEKQKGTISVFAESRNWEAKLLKNGSGISFGFEKAGTKSTDSALVAVNVGETENAEPEADAFTDYTTVLPIELLKNVFHDSLQLKIVFDSNVDTAVAFEVGDSRILSGKLS